MIIYFELPNGDGLKYVYADYTHEEAMCVVEELQAEYGADCAYEIIEC